MNELTKRILITYPEVTIHNLTEYVMDNDPRQGATKLYELCCDGNNIMVIENFDYRKLYSMFNEFMRLKSGTVAIHIHRFISCNVVLMRESHFVLMPKVESNDAIHKCLKMLAPQMPCSSCGCLLKFGTKRLKCNGCFVDYCGSCAEERWRCNYWCKHCNNHMIYHKLVNPLDHRALEQLNGAIANKLTHDVSNKSELINGVWGWGAD